MTGVKNIHFTVWCHLNFFWEDKFHFVSCHFIHHIFQFNDTFNLYFDSCFVNFKKQFTLFCSCHKSKFYRRVFSILTLALSSKCLSFLNIFHTTALSKIFISHVTWAFPCQLFCLDSQQQVVNPVKVIPPAIWHLLLQPCLSEFFNTITFFTLGIMYETDGKK